MTRAMNQGHVHSRPIRPQSPSECLQGRGLLFPSAPLHQSAFMRDLAKAPFLRLLHPVLDQAAVASRFSVREFVAGMIADAVRQKADFRPLAPQPFLQVLSCASLDVPARLIPHAMFIQQTLCELAEGFPTRDSLQAPAALIRPVRPVAATPGD